MRKLLFVLLCLLFMTGLHAQKRPYRIGIKGGLNYIHLENYGNGFYSDFDPLQGWSAGVIFQYTWGRFLKYSVAPELMYTVSKTDVDLIYLTDCLSTIETIDLPVNFKLGLQLSKIFRPYVLGNVYGSYIVSYSGLFFEMLDIDHTSTSSGINRFFIGASAGLGFELWKFQVEGRYRWNLNRIITDDYSALRQMGLELSCAFLF